MILFYFFVATFPLALYFLALAWLHGRSTPCVVSGRRDFVALCAALGGVFFVGPGQLLAAWGASAVWGKYVWVLIAALCFLISVIVASNLRPRYVVYNVDRDALRKAITTTALELDDEACWSGAALNMPGLGVQFYLDCSGIGDSASLIRIGAAKDQEGWLRFGRALRSRLKRDDRSRRKFSVAFFLCLGCVLLAADAFDCIRYSDALREGAAFYLSL